MQVKLENVAKGLLVSAIVIFVGTCLNSLVESDRTGKIKERSACAKLVAIAKNREDTLDAYHTKFDRNHDQCIIILEGQ